jgi:hypothetical protein
MLFELGARVRVVSQDIMEDNPDYGGDEHDHYIPPEGASGILLKEDEGNYGSLLLVYWDKDVGDFVGWVGVASDNNLLRSTGNRPAPGGRFYWVPEYSLEIIWTSTPKVKFRDKLPNESEMNYRICKKVNDMNDKESEKGTGHVRP